MSTVAFEMDLIPAADNRTVQRRAECAGADHLPRCYNPWTDTTACWCGQWWYAGDDALPKLSVPTGHSWLDGWPEGHQAAEFAAHAAAHGSRAEPAIAVVGTTRCETHRAG